ncbi:MAG: hypothetical protein R3190_05345 [Thermoanaerobaculia bacterium]|nr:hypothetical protein [Thermoanaerobaculia bacterium]
MQSARAAGLFAALVLVVGTATAAAEGFVMKRTASGRPDLSGTYDGATMTPLNRPEELGDQQFMTREEAERRMRENAERRARANAQSDPERGAPVLGGGAVKTGGGGGTGGYNDFWLDRGDALFEVDGKFRTSIVYDPPDGRQPPMTPEGQARRDRNFTSFTYVNDGTPSWLDEDGPGPFDGPEELAWAERCILGFSAGPPSVPGAYNNYKTIVQNDDHVVILLEMVHDARIVRLGAGEHEPPEHRKWLGDSIGHWEGDTLVVETTNFREHTGLYGGDENLHLVERFSLLPSGDLLYNFTVDDPTAWTAPWSGEYVWRRSDQKLWEYACHEGNYAMGNALRGARMLEQEELARRAEASSGN